MTRLEMPYLMNVILYIQNADISSIPFISKNCLNACNAMKINPWLNPSHSPIIDYKKVRKTFPNLQTLRIDIYSLREINYEVINSNILMIDIVHSNYNIDTTYIDESLLDKFITSFDGVIRENTKQLCYNHEKDILNQINNNSRISFVYVETLNVKDPQFINYLIDDLNSIKHSVKIRLDLFDCDSSELAKYFNNKNSNITLVVKDNNSNMFIIENENHIELSISPFNNTEMICLYEKYYLPTSFTISYFQKE